MNQDLLHTALLSPTAYPGETGPITFKETHVSRLYFTSEHVYKIKKSVNLGFLDFTSLEKRYQYCCEEVRLNSRLCPATYLGVVEIRRSAKGIAIATTGKLIDYAVKMKRLPDDRMLDRLLTLNPEGLHKDLTRVAQRLARFHAEADIFRAPISLGEETVRRNWTENFSQARTFSQNTLSDNALEILEDNVNTFLASSQPLLNHRQRDGFIRDGHGDLHAGNICLTDPVCIYDCIEFNDRFRIGDVVADMAFLLMDMDFRGHRSLAHFLWNVYTQAFFPGDGAEQILPFFKIYRAFVRAKINAILSSEPEVKTAQRHQAEKTSRQYFNLALGYLCPRILILICGLMGVGKTTIARALNRSIGARHLRSDTVRKELAGRSQTVHLQENYGQGIYTEAMSRKTYKKLLDMTSQSLSNGESVIVDASFSSKVQRRRFFEEAERQDVPAFLIVLQCPTSTVLTRLANRQTEGLDASDGRADLYPRHAENFDPIEPGPHSFEVDTLEDVDYNVQKIICSILTQTGRRQ